MSQKFKSELELQALNNATTDTDKFLVSDGGIVKYRTGSEMLSDLGVTLNTASKLQHQVKAGVAINKGQAVYVTSADGTNMIVGLASNASEATSSKTMGLLDATVAINDFANVVAEGLLSGLNTVGATAGDPVWLGTSGNLIYGLLNKPYAPAHLVFIGIVTRVNANNGEIFVKVQNGFELKEIHDVDIITNVPINGDVLGYDGTLWVNKTIAEWLGYTPANASGTTNYLSKFTGTTSLGNSSIFDNGSAVGIFTSAPGFVTPGRGVLSLNGSSNSLMEFQAGGAFKSYLYQSGTNFEIYDTNAILFSVSGSERMRITSSGNVGIGTTTANYRTQIETTGADVFLTKNTSSTSFNRSFFYNNNNVGIQFLNFGSAYASGTEFNVGVNGSVIQSNTTSAFAVGTSGAYPLLLGTNGTERMRILSGGNVGIGTTSPAYKTDIVGNLRFSTGYLNSDNCFERVFSDAIVFANGTANLAADVILGNSNFWGYIEVEVTSTFNNQSSPGKLTKIFAAGVTPNNNIYANESRVSDAMGPVPNNVAIGDLSWDATNSRYRIPISHIVSTGNTYTVKVRMFTANASSSTGAKGVFDSISIGSTYTLTALSRQYPYYNNKLSIGTSSASAVLTLQNESGAYGTSYPFKMLSYAGTNIFRSYMDGNWNYVNEVFQIGGNSCGYIISTNSSERMRITSSGNVGIGTTSPSQKLSIVGGSSTYAQVNNGSNSIYLGQISSYGLIQSDLDLALLSGGSERMRITSAGNVGIGTTSPGSKLTIADSVNGGSGAIVTNNNTGSSAYGYVAAYSPDGGIELRAYPTANALGKHTRVESTSGNTSGLLINQAGANPISFWNNGSEKMRIASGGNIGIGTTSPSYPLHVSAQVSNVSIYADYDIVAYSDQSVKENIRPIDNALERVIESRGVLYDRIDSGEKDNIGFIAQELEVAFPELVVTNPDGTKAVKYQNAVAVLFEAVKEQQKQIDEIKRILNGLTN